jgi:hypothetical protein
MHWQSLVLASEIFRERQPTYDRLYLEYMSSRDEAAWHSDAGPNDAEIVRLLRFLNQWASHHPSDPDARAGFKRAYLDVLPRLRVLQGLSLLEAAFGSGVVQDVEAVFEGIARSGGRYASTATSKILHVLNPQLFVMWDSAIRGAYGVDASSCDYAKRFLPRVQRQAKEAVDSYTRNGRADPVTAVQDLEGLCDGRPLAKLVDEHNYCKFTLRRDELWGIDTP